MYNIIPIIIIIISIAVIIYIIVRKLPFLANFEVDKMPTEIESETKTKIVEQRLERKARSALGKISPVVSKISQFGQEKFKKVYENLKNLENQYKKKPKKQEIATQQEYEDYEKKLDEMLKSAEDLIEQEKYEEAEKRYIEIIGIDPKSTEAFRGLGNLYLLMKNYDDAKQTFEHILKINEMDDWAYARLSKVAQEQGDLSKAKDNIKKSLEIKNTAIHYFELAEVNNKLEEYDEALNNLQQALDIEPNNPKYLDLFITIAIKSKHKKSAANALEHLKEINPDNQKIEEFEAEIKEL